MKRNVLGMCLIVIAACATPEPEQLPDRAEPATSSVSSELGNACSLQCNNGNLQCNSTCERFPRPNCEENCDTRLANCLRACGCPFVEEFDRVTLDHADPTSTLLCVGNIPNPGVLYQVFNTFKRTDHVRQTLQCDSTLTEVVLSSVVSPNGACTHRLFPDQSCFHSTVLPQGLCTF